MSEAVVIALISAISGIIIAVINGRDHTDRDDVDKLEHEVRELQRELKGRKRRDGNHPKS
ncbi:hypothetical protein [Lacticaseibacillus salsurivasis]|uniref:hypothetical protein n=1 Tax=Lacticaseibacillus salsurivasis TaxID=3081441 RepID=UPI0030C69D1E